MMADTPVWKVELVVPESAVGVFEQALEPVAAAVTSFSTTPVGPWRLEAYIPGRPHHEGIIAAVALAARRANVPEPPFVCMPVPDRDWVLESQAHWRPTRAGRFYVHPTHLGRDRPPGCWPVVIDAGTAFGSGEHATTRTCLLAISDFVGVTRPRRPLDVGCGSGILSIAMAKAWRRPVTACDIDPEAVRVTRMNARRNGVGPLIGAHCADGVRSRALRLGHSYDFIVANILARPLTAMARDLAQVAAPRGIAILSGLLEAQERVVLNAYRAQGLHLLRRYPHDGWLTLVVRRGLVRPPTGQGRMSRWLRATS